MDNSSMCTKKCNTHSFIILSIKPPTVLPYFITSSFQGAMGSARGFTHFTFFQMGLLYGAIGTFSNPQELFPTLIPKPFKVELLKVHTKCIRLSYGLCSIGKGCCSMGTCGPWEGTILGSSAQYPLEARSHKNIPVGRPAHA